MKKYIRRANGVYELKIDEKLKKANVSNCFYTSDNDTNWNLLFEKEDLKQFKQANTIEELCDEFVFHVENQGHWVINNYKRALEIAKSYNEDEIKFICCGAIRTDKGLIYVAKMNEKGELECHDLQRK